MQYNRNLGNLEFPERFLHADFYNWFKFVMQMRPFLPKRHLLDLKVTYNFLPFEISRNFFDVTSL